MGASPAVGDSHFAMIIIPGQSGTYRHLQAHVTDLLAESGQIEPASPCRVVLGSATSGWSLSAIASAFSSREGLAVAGSAD